MNPIDRMMAWSQFALSIIFLGASLYLIYAGKLTADNAAWLRDADLVVIYFWFQRTRIGGIPDQTNMVTQTHTTPDGTKTVITSPAAKPVVTQTTVDSTKTSISKPPLDPTEKPI